MEQLICCFSDHRVKNNNKKKTGQKCMKIERLSILLKLIFVSRICPYVLIINIQGDLRKNKSIESGLNTLGIPVVDM